jgi:hypothetical protein
MFGGGRATQKQVLPISSIHNWASRSLAPETARREARVQLGRVAGGDDAVEDRQFDHKAITVKEPCTRYLADLQAGLILGKGGRPKKASTIVTDTGRIERHIIPLIGTRRVKDLTKTDINKVLKDIMAGNRPTTMTGDRTLPALEMLIMSGFLRSAGRVAVRPARRPAARTARPPGGGPALRGASRSAAGQLTGDRGRCGSRR